VLWCHTNLFDVYDVFPCGAHHFALINAHALYRVQGAKSMEGDFEMTQRYDTEYYAMSLYKQSITVRSLVTSKQLKSKSLCDTSTEAKCM